MTERKTEERNYCGTYEVYSGDKLVGRQDLDPHGVSILYINYHGVEGYTIRKVE